MSFVASSFYSTFMKSYNNLISYSLAPSGIPLYDHIVSTVEYLLLAVFLPSCFYLGCHRNLQWFISSQRLNIQCTVFIEAKKYVASNQHPSCYTRSISLSLAIVCKPRIGFRWRVLTLINKELFSQLRLCEIK